MSASPNARLFVVNVQFQASTSVVAESKSPNTSELRTRLVPWELKLTFRESAV
eukprot:CAMPEP_0175907744 /NCGR_PEP_ID=MMETSP0108-20121206/6224_1 /TAXON_ID=195067 ORGANISM="Goniomonas pacifica, Strain CCMP1869" /NCGR_SAMPLE_ID=MMETSP0108 /ASSEMBLY_ACC=CAM_ASM_000204 /LENGTH=52 /DNA_ID=CAMNT_0017229745 /DNA_START=359 /DNA_END=514 /DNA_ORIENTATION=-